VNGPTSEENVEETRRVFVDDVNRSSKRRTTEKRQKSKETRERERKRAEGVQRKKKSNIQEVRESK